MRGCAASLLLLVVALPVSAAADAAAIEVRRVALEFGNALIGRDLSLLEPMLPGQGRVRMRLLCLGPEDGTFSPAQVRMLLHEFLADGAISEFRVLSIDGDRSRFAMIHTRANITDRDGRPARLDLHLSFRNERGRWVLREIHESPP